MNETNSADRSMNEIREDLAAYSLNALEPEQRAQVERLLAVSEDARVELRELMEGAEALSYLAGDAALPAELRERILEMARPAPIAIQRAAISSVPSDNTSKLMGFGSWFSAARIAYAGSSIALTGMLAIAVLFGIENTRLSREVDKLTEQVSESRGTIDGLQSTVTAASLEVDEQKVQMASLESSLRNQRWLTYVTLSGGFNVTRWLAGGAIAPEADGTLWVSTSDNKAVFVVHGLPIQPPGKEYHLWLEGGTFRHDVAIFTVNESGQAQVEFTLRQSIYDYDRAVVTLENAASFVPRPTGDEVLRSP